ncbi:MAG TPA: hypothetical protein VHU84_03245 [Lacipirellulaceae bacterium]|nr:hypothetical protein [Lacipirellulaceae bacterium]
MRSWMHTLLNAGYGNHPQRRLFAAICGLVCALLTSGTLLAQQDLAGRIEEARKNFKPVTKEQVSQARADVQKQMQAVEQFIQPSSQNGRQWMHYLQWDDLKKQVDANNSSGLEALDTSLSKLNRNVSGLERRQFRQLARALRHYRNTLAISSWQNPAQLYSNQLDELQKAVEAYHKEASEKNTAALNRQILIIDSTGQAPEVVKAVQKDLAQPNAFVNISTDYISAGTNRIDRCDPESDCILGTSTHGTAHTNGSVKVVSVSSRDKAVLELHSLGHVFSQDIGFNGPAVIHSTADTDYTSMKRVELSDPAFTAGPARVDATTDTHVHSIAKQGGGLGSRLVSRIGWKKAGQTKGQVDAIASEHAEGRIENRFDDEVTDRLAKTREQYESDYRRPLERSGNVPEHIRFSSDPSGLAMEVAQASRSELGAPGGPPSAKHKHDITMRLHQTAVDNYTAAVMGGATAKQDSQDEELKFNVALPSWMDHFWKQRKAEPTHDAAAKAEKFEPFTMTLNDTHPVVVEFSGGKITMSLHMSELHSGKHDFDPWVVIATYTPEISNGSLILHRDPELKAHPEGSEKIGGVEAGENKNIIEDFDKRSAQGTGFPLTLEFAPMRPEGELADAGKLGYTEISCDDGWAVIGMDRVAKQSNESSRLTSTSR